MSVRILGGDNRATLATLPERILVDYFKDCYQ